MNRYSATLVLHLKDRQPQTRHETLVCEQALQAGQRIKLGGTARWGITEIAPAQPQHPQVGDHLVAIKDIE